MCFRVLLKPRYIYIVENMSIDAHIKGFIYNVLEIGQFFLVIDFYFGLYTYYSFLKLIIYSIFYHFSSLIKEIINFISFVFVKFGLQDCSNFWKQSLQNEIEIFSRLPQTCQIYLRYIGVNPSGSVVLILSDWSFGRQFVHCNFWRVVFLISA